MLDLVCGYLILDPGSLISKSFPTKRYLMSCLVLAVGLAKVLFPREAQIVMNLAHLEATSEFTGVDKAGAADNVSASNSPLFSGKTSSFVGWDCSFSRANTFHGLNS